MFYKQDWPEAKDRLNAWWNQEIVDRPAISVTAPRAGIESAQAWDAWDFSRYPDDPIRAITNFEARCFTTFFGGESFPNCWINLGAGAVAAFLGANASFYSDTVWFETPMEWDQLTGLELDPGNEWWIRVKRDTELGVERGAGRFFVAITDLGGILDIAHSLRGKKQIMIDLFRDGSRVKDLLWRILETWHRCYEELHAMIQTQMKGSSTWMGIWCKDRWYPLQCDYAYMLSPSKFDEFVLPDVEEQCRRLDNTVYHLDGYGQIPHLEKLLDIPELNAIQWVPGAGKPQCGSSVHYPLYRRIRSRGKGLVLNLAPDEIEPICREIGPEGVLFMTGCRTEEDAMMLLEESRNWV